MTETSYNTTLGHVMPVLPSCDTDSIVNTTNAFVVQDDQNEMQHDFFSHLTLASASRYAH